MAAPRMLHRRFGRLVVVDRAAPIGGKRMFVCKCDCGSTVTTRGSDLRGRAATSCGCYHRQRAAEAQTMRWARVKAATIT